MSRRRARRCRPWHRRGGSTPRRVGDRDERTTPGDRGGRCLDARIVRPVRPPRRPQVERAARVPRVVPSGRDGEREGGLEALRRGRPLFERSEAHVARRSVLRIQTRATPRAGRLAGDGPRRSGRLSLVAWDRRRCARTDQADAPHDEDDRTGEPEHASDRGPRHPSEAATEQRLRIHGGGRHLVGEAEEDVSDVGVVHEITSGVVRSASRPRATSERTVAWRHPRSSAIVASGRSS